MAGEIAHVALLRGINVGGRNVLPMKALLQLAAEAGVRGAATHIQSGNVLFRASAAGAARFCEELSTAIAAAHGLRVPVQVRSVRQMEAVVAANPFAGEDAKLLYVAFLSAVPTAAQVASLDPDRSPPDRFRVVGDVVYLHLPNGAGQTKLTNAYLDAKLGCVSTWRNWGVSGALLRLLRET